MPKIGDFVLLAGLLLASGWFWFDYTGQSATQVEIRQNGKLTATYSLRLDRQIIVHGPLGNSLVEIRAGRVRVAQDPGPRQYCVRQGWLSQSGEIAICLPSKLTVSLTGSTSQPDSLGY